MKKDYRIKKSTDFDKIIKKRKSFANKQFIIYYDKNEIEHMRLGISVSKRLGKAHKRNKIKRYIREVFKTRKDKLKSYNLIVIARNQVVDLTLEEYEKSIDHILKKLKMYKEKRD